MFRSFAIISVLACAALPVCAQDLSGTGAGILDQAKLARRAIAVHNNDAALEHIQYAVVLADRIMSQAPPEESPVVVPVSKEIQTTTTYRPVKRGKGPLTPKRMKKYTSAREVQQDITTADLNVTNAANDLEAAQLALERDDRGAADVWLERVAGDVTEVNANRDAPLLMVRQNLRLARSRVLEGKYEDAQAPLRAAAQGLQDFERQFPGPQATQAAYMRGQILNFAHIIKHDRADALRLIDQWLTPVDRWVRQEAVQ